MNRACYHLCTNSIKTEEQFIKTLSGIPMKEAILVLEEIDTMRAALKIEDVKEQDEKKEKQTQKKRKNRSGVNRSNKNTRLSLLLYR